MPNFITLLTLSQNPSNVVLKNLLEPNILVIAYFLFSLSLSFLSLLLTFHLLPFFLRFANNLISGQTDKRFKYVLLDFCE